MIEQIKIPKTCPSCNSDLETVNSQLFCRNKDCPAQSSKKVEAFVKKMRIKGLGPATISKLGFVRPIEIYETSLEDYVEILGEKIGHKIFDEVQNSRTTTFATFLSALSIPLIGDTASKKIATVATGIEDLFNLESLPIGEKAKLNISEYLLSLEPAEFSKFVSLSDYMNFKGTSKIQVAQDKGNVCITGKLKDFSNRSKAKEYLEEHGYTVTSTVSGKTNFLVCEDGSNSSKSKKAESLGIPIVTIDSLIN